MRYVSDEEIEAIKFRKDTTRAFSDLNFLSNLLWEHYQEYFLWRLEVCEGNISDEVQIEVDKERFNYRTDLIKEKIAMLLSKVNTISRSNKNGIKLF